MLEAGGFHSLSMESLEDTYQMYINNYLLPLHFVDLLPSNKEGDSGDDVFMEMDAVVLGPFDQFTLVAHTYL